MLALILSIAPASANTITITGYDPGGEVDTYSTFYQRIFESGDMVEVDGACVSACTIVFSLPSDRICMTERAVFGFHKVSNTGHDDDMTELYVRDNYPRWLLDMIAERGGLKKWLLILYAEDLVEHIQMCPGHAVPTHRTYVSEKELPSND